MSKCPKCQTKLHLYNVSQFCPSCGVNMRFFNFEEKFIREAKLAELSQAGLKVKLSNLKYSFMGSKLITAKLIVMLLPLVSLLIPSGSVTVSLPFITSEFHFGILGLVNLFTGGGFSYILSMVSSELVGAEFSALRTALFVYIAVALFAVFCLLFSLLGFISIKYMQRITTVFASLGALSSVAALIFILIFNSKANNSILIDSSVGFGIIVTLIMFVAVFFVNFMLWKKGIHPNYDEGVTERVAIYKQVKAGKINIDDLPQPVVETAATRKIDEAIAAEEAAFYKKMHSENKEDA